MKFVLQRLAPGGVQGLTSSWVDLVEHLLFSWNRAEPSYDNDNGDQNPVAAFQEFME